MVNYNILNVHNYILFLFNIFILYNLNLKKKMKLLKIQLNVQKMYLKDADNAIYKL